RPRTGRGRTYTGVSERPGEWPRGAPQFDRVFPLSENNRAALPGDLNEREVLHGQGRQKRRADPGAPQGRPEVSAAEGLQGASAREERVGLPRGGEEPRTVLGAAREGADLVQAVEEGARVEAAVRQVVRGRQAQRRLQLSRPPRAGPASHQ